MRKVFGIGETILDIIFRNDQPQKAVPGGSVFNGLISLGRLNVPVSFISERGNDRGSGAGAWNGSGAAASKAESSSVREIDIRRREIVRNKRGVAGAYAPAGV